MDPATMLSISGFRGSAASSFASAPTITSAEEPATTFCRTPGMSTVLPFRRLYPSIAIRTIFRALSTAVSSAKSTCRAPVILVIGIVVMTVVPKHSAAPTTAS